jgi:hypothetical protein
MCSTSIASEFRKPPALLIRGGGRIIIDCRRRIYWNRSIVEENTARGDRHGNREAKKPKKLKPKESGLISTLASIQASATAHKSAGRERSRVSRGRFRSARAGPPNTLARYLFRTEDSPVSLLSHDHRFDELLADNFLDVAKIHDDLSFLRAELHETAVQSFGFSRTLSPESLEVFSYAQARWINAHVQTLLIYAIFGVPGARNLVADALDRVRTAVLQVQRRMSPPA